MQALSAVFLSTPKIATDQDNLTGNLTDRVLVKLSEFHSLPECRGMMDVGSLDEEKSHTARSHTHTHTHAHAQSSCIRRHAVLPYFPNTNTYGPIRSQPPSIKSTSCAGGWNSAGLESGRPNPSVRGGRGVCHPPLWAPSSWKREWGDRGWWGCGASGCGRSSCREETGTGAARQPRGGTLCAAKAAAPPDLQDAGWRESESGKETGSTGEH